MEKEMFFGFNPSKFDGTEYVITEDRFGTLPLPKAYSYYPYMSPIMNQGNDPICVPCSISAVYDYFFAMTNPETTTKGKFRNSEIAVRQIYAAKTNYGDGMSYKEALDFCKNIGVVTNSEYRKNDFSNPKKITMYGRVMSMEAVKYAIVANGPCLIATMVKDIDAAEFWKGNSNYGGHATCLIGYDDSKKSFLLRNSWGTSFGSKGYVWLPYEDFPSTVIEAWTVII